MCTHDDYVITWQQTYIYKYLNTAVGNYNTTDRHADYNPLL